MIEYDISYQQKLDARLVATVIPKFSHYLPIAPRRDRKYFYNENSLRLMCDQLFELVSCSVVYSKEIPEKEYVDASSKEMVVTQVRIYRHVHN